MSEKHLLFDHVVYYHVISASGKKNIIFKVHLSVDPLFRYFYNQLSNYTKTIIRFRLVNIAECSPRLRVGEYSPIFTSPSANNC